MQTRLPREFFARDTVTVAQELLGKTLFYKGQIGRITETEAYIGMDDPACHAAKGCTPRTQPMFGPAGFSYVYLIYGMYFCLNFVTEAEGFPAAVLIRGVVYADGPGKLCRTLGITKQDNQIDLVTSPHLMVLDTGIWTEFKATPRIGIKVGLEKHWRFVVDKGVLKPSCNGQPIA